MTAEQVLKLAKRIQDRSEGVEVSVMVNMHTDKWLLAILQDSKDLITYTEENIDLIKLMANNGYHVTGE